MGHHTTPQKYLSGFSIREDSDKIWLYDKKKQEFSKSPVAIKKVAQQKNFYTAEDEKLLAIKVELPANIVIERLRNGASMEDLSEEDRSHLAIYIGTLMYRVPQHRNHALQRLPEVLKTVIQDTKKKLFA